MNPDSVEFYLPLGLEWEGKLYRNGHIRHATTLDELEIQDQDDVAINTRYRDILLFSKIIINIGDLKPVTVPMVENLFEADFLYLQLLYADLNLNGDSKVAIECPACASVIALDFPGLYNDMSLYQQKDDET